MKTYSVSLILAGHSRTKLRSGLSLERAQAFKRTFKPAKGYQLVIEDDDDAPNDSE